MKPIVLLALIGLSSALSIDNIGAGIALGLARKGRLSSGDRLRVALAFGGVAVLAPLPGLFLGPAVAPHVDSAGRLLVDRLLEPGLAAAVAPYVGSAGRLLGGAILLFIGIDVIVRGGNESFSPIGDVRHLLVTAGSVNIDSLLSGVALGMGNVPILPSELAMAGVTTGLTMLALEIGGHIGQRFDHRGGPIGGVVLVAIAIGLMTGFVK
jgi:putative Mn2+ efflux pump MntP